MFVRSKFPILVIGLLLSPKFGFTQDKKDEKKFPPISPNNARLVQTINGLDGPGLAIARSDRAGLIAAAGDGSTIQLWGKDVLSGIRSGDNTANKLRGHTGTITDLAWNGGPHMVSVGADKKLIWWEVASGKTVKIAEVPYLVRSLVMSPDGKFVASVGDSANVQIWDSKSAKPVKELKGHKDWVLCVQYSPNGKYLASGGYDGQALLWDAGSGNKIREIPQQKKKSKDDPGPEVVTEVAFSPDSKQVAVGRANGDVELVDANSGRLTRTLDDHSSSITGLVYHPKGELLVSSSKDSDIRLWDPRNGRTYKTLEDHKAWVEDVVFVRQGTRLASVGADRTVRIWDLTED